jgi:hypothetical protein
MTMSENGPGRPDSELPFAAAAHTQSQARAIAEHEAEGQSFIDALSEDIARDD